MLEPESTWPLAIVAVAEVNPRLAWGRDRSERRGSAGNGLDHRWYGRRVCVLSMRICVARYPCYLSSEGKTKTKKGFSPQPACLPAWLSSDRHCSIA